MDYNPEDKFGGYFDLDLSDAFMEKIYNGDLTIEGPSFEPVKETTAECDMEYDYALKIDKWSLDNYTQIQDLEQNQINKLYWKEVEGYEVTNSSSFGALDIIG